MAEAMKLGYVDRYAALGDTGYGSIPLKGYISKEYAAQRAKLIDLKQARPVTDLSRGDPLAFEGPSTTHLSVVDRDGNVVSLTNTLGSDFGSGVIASGTGVLINNQMSNIRHEQAWQKRWPVTGTPGGNTVIDTVVQVIVNTVDFGLNVAEATHQSRIYQGSSGPLDVEPNFNPDTVAALKAKGHRVVTGETKCSAQSIMINRGLLLGAADPRRPGARAVDPER